MNDAAAPVGIGADVVIVESGGANIASLRFALERLGARAEVSADARRIRAASHVILPGVGAAATAMARLRELRLEETICGLTQPVLGICLGMQLLFETSEEGPARCLGIIRGGAARLRGAPDLPVPHMGWNTLRFAAGASLFTGLPDGAHVYFVHSYALPAGECTVATSSYGTPFSAGVQWRNFHGVQFHPERSAAAGARLLHNFLTLA